MSSASSSLRSLCAAQASLQCRFRCVSSSAASFASGGGSGGFGGESGGGGGCSGNGGGGGQSGSDGGDAKSKLAAGAGGEASALSSDVIILDVGVCLTLYLTVDACTHMCVCVRCGSAIEMLKFSVICMSWDKFGRE